MLPYALQAAALAASHPSHAIVQAAPLTQAEFFLDSVWAVMPADPAGQSVVGLTVDALRRGRKQMTSAWQFSADRMDKIPDLLAWANRYNVDPTHAEAEMGSVWWQGASRKSEVLHREYARGGATDLNYIGAMWADLDCANAGIPLEKAFDAVMNMAVKPSIIVFSGGGLQVIHLLASAWNVSTIEAAQQYKMISRAFYEPLYQVSGTEADKAIHNADRMMRLPGFINRKKAREGARASLLWVDETRYSSETIREASAPYLPAPRAPLGTRPERDDLDPDNYAVSQNFIAYIVQGAVVPEGHRHATLLSLAMDAARAGISRATAQRLFESRAAKWYRGEDFKQELYEILEWAYERATYEEAAPLLEGDTDDVPFIGAPPAEWLVKIEPAKADEPAEVPAITLISDDDEATRRAGERIIEIPYKQSHIEKMSVQALRAEQEQVITGYLNREVSMASVLRLKTPPGAGKTHSALQAVVAWALRSLEAVEEDEAPVDGAIVATLFKMNRAEGMAWARGFGIDPLLHPRLFYFFIGRTDDQNSKGYCARHAIAEAVAAKGRNVITSVCARCPARTACEERYYLSQFDEAEKAGIIVLRAQHLYMSELLTKRKLLLIDESPFHVVSAGLRIKITELHLNDLPPSSADQWPEEVGALDLFLSYLREIMASNRAATVDDSHIRFGGRWLFDRLIEKMGTPRFEAVVGLDSGKLDDLSKVTIFGDLTLEAASKLPVHFLPTLIKLLKAEYTIFKSGATEWNSRIIPHGQELHLYPMEPFAFGTHTRVIVTDATDPDSFYAKAFVDTRGRPRQIIPYERALVPKGRSTVYIGTENSKTTLLETTNGLTDKIDLKKWFGKRKVYSYADTVELAELVRNAGNPALAQAMLLIHTLAERHEGSLLVVLYKKLFDEGKENAETFLKSWVTRSGVLRPELVQWFGNLRGKNDYKHLNAVLAIGTPRLREADLRIQAQTWNHRDPVPVSFEKEILTEPYEGFVDSKGMGRAYRYVGFKDPRVNSLYLNSMQSELEQCLARIRKNSSEVEKHAYLATAFPAADQVDEFLVYQNIHVDSVASLILQRLFDATQAEGAPQRLQPYLDELAKQAGVSGSTARRAYDRVRESGIDPRDGEKWAEKLDAFEGMKRNEAILLKWFNADPKRLDYPSRIVVEMLLAENIEVSRSVIVRFLDRYRKN